MMKVNVNRGDHEMNECNKYSSNQVSVKSKVGDVIIRFFHNYGSFKEEVAAINASSVDAKFTHTHYEDDDHTNVSQEEFDAFKITAIIPIGGLGFQFIK